MALADFGRLRWRIMCDGLADFKRRVGDLWAMVLVRCGWLFGGFRPAFAADVARTSGGLWATVWRVMDDGSLKVRFTSGDGVGGFVAVAA